MDPQSVRSDNLAQPPSVQETQDEDFVQFMGFCRTEQMKSGGLFILFSQEECQKASTATRIGHAVLGAAKAAAAVAFVATGAWLVAQTFTGLTAIPALVVGCCLAILFQSPLPILLPVIVV